MFGDKVSFKVRRFIIQEKGFLVFSIWLSPRVLEKVN